VADAFGKVCREGQHRVLAATVHPVHAHLLFASLKHPIETVVGWLKRQSAAAVFKSRRARGFATPRHLWTDRRFVVFIDDETYLFNTIEYIRRHNLEAGLSADPFSWIEPLRSGDT
jgi:REP element-mobilizing transposase RayT